MAGPPPVVLPARRPLGPRQETDSVYTYFLLQFTLRGSRGRTRSPAGPSPPSRLSATATRTSIVIGGLRRWRVMRSAHARVPHRGAGVEKWVSRALAPVWEFDAPASLLSLSLSLSLSLFLVSASRRRDGGGIAPRALSRARRARAPRPSRGASSASSASSASPRRASPRCAPPRPRARRPACPSTRR